MTKKIKYPVLPHIAYGLVDDIGFYVSVPFRGISLNEYKKMHHGKISALRGQYKSIVDLIIIACIKRNYIKWIDDNGIVLLRSLFSSKVTVDWVLTWANHNSHDPSNYTQKILLDAIVDTGILEDDSCDYVKNDNVMFGDCWYDSITCIIKGTLNKQMFKSNINTINENDIMEALLLL